MRRPALATLLAVLVLAPQAAQGQILPRPLNPQETLKLTGVGDGVVAKWAGVYVGPYGGTITSGNPTIPQITLYCVDYADDVKIGDTWQVNVTGLGGTPDLSNTLLGNAAGSLANYQQAAYLASLFSSWGTFVNNAQYAYNGGTLFANKAAVYSGIHAAIWSIMTPSFTSAPALALAMAAPFIQAAGTALAQSFPTMNFNDWSVLSDVGESVGNPPHPGQEYLVHTPGGGVTTTVTPEPETYVLLLTGLLFVFGVTRLRGKKRTALA